MKINSYRDYEIRIAWIRGMEESARKALQKLQDECPHEVWVDSLPDLSSRMVPACKKCGAINSYILDKGTDNG